MQEETLDPNIIGNQNTEQRENKMNRDEPNPAPSTEASITDWLKKIRLAETHWTPRFNKMKQDAKFAAGYQWNDQKLINDDRYSANITLRHINQRVAAIYAKNPRVRAERARRMWHQLWDGTPEMLNDASAAIALEERPDVAQALITQGAMKPPTMDAQMAKIVMLEAQQTVAEKEKYDKIGKTLEIVAHYSMEEGSPRFKPQAKQLVRRVLTCSVGYIKLGYQRIMEPTPEVDAKIKDDSDKLRMLEILAADLEDEEIDKNSAEAEKLRVGIEALQDQQNIVLREGLVFSFPKAWNIIPDINTIQLKGFVGAHWVAEKYLFTARQVKEIYDVDLKKGDYTSFNYNGGKFDNRRSEEDFCAVYEVYDLDARVCFTLCQGYKDYLKDPGEPDVDLEKFHPYSVLSFNDIESDESIYPPSDVELIKPMAMEYNRSREGLRNHRIANTPALIATQGVMGKGDLEKITNHLPNEVVQTKLNKSDDINKLLVAKPTVPIDPALYNTDELFQDAKRVVGTNEEELGNVSRVSATASSIAEGSRATGIQSNTDDLDECLTEVFRGAGQILIMNMSEKTVKEIAGEGAVWPTATREEVAKELMLSVKAGSSGRPNAQLRLQKLERVLPTLMQMPDLDPEKLTELQLREFDENLEIDDFRKSGMPSIVAQNSMAKPNMAPGNSGVNPPGGGAANAEKPTESGAKDQNMGQQPPETPAGAG